MKLHSFRDIFELIVRALFCMFLYAISSSGCLLNSIKIKLFEQSLYKNFVFSNLYKMSSGANALSGVKPKFEVFFLHPGSRPKVTIFSQK